MTFLKCNKCFKSKISESTWIWGRTRISRSPYPYSNKNLSMSNWFINYYRFVSLKNKIRKEFLLLLFRFTSIYQFNVTDRKLKKFMVLAVSYSGFSHIWCLKKYSINQKFQFCYYHKRSGSGSVNIYRVENQQCNAPFHLTHHVAAALGIALTPILPQNNCIVAYHVLRTGTLVFPTNIINSEKEHSLTSKHHEMRLSPPKNI